MASERARRKRKKRGDPKNNGAVDDHVLFDVRGVRQLSEKSKRREQIDEHNEPTWVEASSLDARLLTKHDSLIEVIKMGVPERKYHALSHGILVKGKRHLCAAPAKVGKSIAWQAHLTKMCLEGETVLYIDKENGADEFARRLDCFVKAWKLTDAELDLIDKHFLYFEFPRLEITDGEGLNRVIADAGADLIVFDSQRMVLSDLGLAEDSSDDYGKFMNQFVMGLNATVLLLDNTGHSDKDRGRGTSSKIDMNEVLFTMAELKAFDTNKEGSLVLRQVVTRFESGGPWTMNLGGGTYAPWHLGEPTLTAEELVLSVMPPAGDRITGNKMETAWAGRGHGTARLREARTGLIAEGALGTNRDEVSKTQTVYYWRVEG